MGQLWVHHQILYQLMHFYVFMNKYNSIIALRILNLYITEDMQMRYLREKFTRYLHSKDKNITFSYEKESNDSLLLLDILISISKNGFKRSVYHKLTFSGVCSNFKSFIHDQYKIGLAFTLLFQFSLNFPGFIRKSVI